MTTGSDPEVTAIATICSALGELESDAARQRVVDFASAKFGLTGVSRPLEKAVSTQEDPQDDADFFASHEHSKPAENVALLVAHHYSKCGTQPFSVSELKQSADAAGLVVPARIDMTLNAGVKQGKKLYQKLEGGRYRVTVHGESFLKATYKVKKGLGGKQASSTTE